MFFHDCSIFLRNDFILLFNYFYPLRKGVFCLLEFLLLFLYGSIRFSKNFPLHRDCIFLFFNDKILFLQIAPAAICRFRL